MAATPCDVRPAANGRLDRWIGRRVANNRRISNMTMPTHAGGRFKLVRYSSAGQDAAGTGAYARKATIRRFGMRALTILIVGGVVAGIIALKAAIFLSRLNY